MRHTVQYVELSMRRTGNCWDTHQIAEAQSDARNADEHLGGLDYRVSLAGVQSIPGQQRSHTCPCRQPDLTADNHGETLREPDQLACMDDRR